MGGHERSIDRMEEWREGDAKLALERSQNLERRLASFDVSLTEIKETLTKKADKTDVSSSKHGMIEIAELVKWAAIIGSFVGTVILWLIFKGPPPSNLAGH